jgi:hypothetical protein
VFTSGDWSWASVWDDERVTLPGVTVTISELSATEMVGRFHGNAFQFNQAGELSSIIGVDVSFRAGQWAGGEWPCE